MKEISIHVNLFGAFRKFGDTLDISVPVGSTVAVVKKAISRLLKGSEASLVFDSVLAGDNDILTETHVFNGDARLCILPPVCGG